MEQIYTMEILYYTLLGLGAAFCAYRAMISKHLLPSTLYLACVSALTTVTLYLLGAYYPRFFDSFHTAVWQIVIILAAILFFLLWSARVAPARLATRG